MRWQRWSIALGLVVLLVLLGWGLAQRFERVEAIIEMPPSGEARTHPLLALERLLQRFDQTVVATSERAALRHLPSVDSVFVLYGAHPSVTPVEVQALLDWVNQGGSLVIDAQAYVSEDLPGEKFPLLEALGFLLEATDCSCDESALVFFEDAEAPVEVLFDQSTRLFDLNEQDFYGVADEHGYWLVQLVLGDGYVTLVNNLDVFSNTRIDEAEHGFFAWQLLNNSESIHLLYNPQPKSLWEWLLQHAWPLLLGLLLLGTLWLWAGNRRLGPLSTPAAEQTADLFDHLDAQGGFEWRHGLSAQRLLTSQALVEHRWMVSHPGLRSVDQAERVAVIAQYSGLDASEVEQALYLPASKSTDYVIHTRLLQRLWQYPHTGSRTTVQ